MIPDNLSHAEQLTVALSFVNIALGIIFVICLAAFKTRPDKSDTVWATLAFVLVYIRAAYRTYYETDITYWSTCLHLFVAVAWAKMIVSLIRNEHKSLS
jgi:hypothetical protein